MPSQPQMPEAQLQAAVVKLCRLFGLKHHHQRYSIGSGAGWPDLTICGTTIIFRELKREDGKLTVAQMDWGQAIDKSGCDWDVWRPSHLRSGRIQRELEALR
jgi:hypothetical protein